MTAWANRGAELLGLTAGDIRAMDKGQRLEVILLDRNLGEYVRGAVVGSTYDPTIKGCTYAIYTHGSGLTGKLKFLNSGYTDKDFTWEINGPAIGSDLFWRPINGCSSCGTPDVCGPDDISDGVFVGWRGPCIRKADALMYLPRVVRHYDTWYDDYVPYRYHNYLTME